MASSSSSAAADDDDNPTLLMTIAQWAWSSDPSPNVTPSTCLSSLPFLRTPCLIRLVAKFIGIAIIASSCINKGECGRKRHTTFADPLFARHHESLTKTLSLSLPRKQTTAPVIHNIYSTKSALGLSPTSTYSEVIMYSNAALYNLRKGHPFSSYGETFMVMIQTWIVVIMIWIYGAEDETKEKKKKSVTMGHMGVVCGVYLIYLLAVFYGELDLIVNDTTSHTVWSYYLQYIVSLHSLCVLVFTFFLFTLKYIYFNFPVWGFFGYYTQNTHTKVLTQDTIYLLMVYNPIVLLTSRGSQILANHQQKQTGAQSLATTGMNLTGSLIRTVTTIKEVGWDLHILRSYGTSITLNMILFTQIFMYREKTNKMLGDLKKKKKKE